MLNTVQKKFDKQTHTNTTQIKRSAKQIGNNPDLNNITNKKKTIAKQKAPLLCATITVQQFLIFDLTGNCNDRSCVCVFVNAFDTHWESAAEW